MPPTLTKKAKKALAFRQKKSGKFADDALDVPAVEILEEAERAAEPVAPVEPPKRIEAHVRKEQAAQADVKENDETPGTAVTSTGKRKRPSIEDDPKPKKKAKKARDADDSTQDNKEKPRFILFLGNLSYRTTKEQIQEHFKACDPPPAIRLLTPKASPAKPTAKSKGCAFLEFKSHNTLQQGLKLHGSELGGRKINVELTAGGGGKSAQRLTKVKERNKALTAQRKKRIQKVTGAAEADIEKPQRHSTTSGEELAAPMKKTWSVGDEAAGRGGKKRKATKVKKPSKSWGTGANAIIVG